MAYKRILTIQDISCVGQCSMTVAMPVLSACGHECCILPTAVLSTHTGGFGKPAVHHLSDSMEAICRHWRGQGIVFDAILVGYLGSRKAVDRAAQILDTMLAPGGVSIVDPAMADHGKLYGGLDQDYADAMMNLCRKADIMLPNITEAAMMCGLPYRREPDPEYVQTILDTLEGNDVVLTGVGYEKDQTGAAYRFDGKTGVYHHPRIGKSYHGTGDLFAACFTGSLMQGLRLDQAVALASEFTLRCIENTELQPAHWYGVKFEQVLPWLIQQLSER